MLEEPCSEAICTSGNEDRLVPDPSCIMGSSGVNLWRLADLAFQRLLGWSSSHCQSRASIKGDMTVGFLERKRPSWVSEDELEEDWPVGLARLPTTELGSSSRLVEADQSEKVIIAKPGLVVEAYSLKTLNVSSFQSLHLIIVVRCRGSLVQKTRLWYGRGEAQSFISLRYYEDLESAVIMSVIIS